VVIGFKELPECHCVRQVDRALAKELEPLGQVRSIGAARVLIALIVEEDLNVVRHSSKPHRYG
jgi:hypothetical protein